MPIGEQNKGAEGAAKGVTSTVSSSSVDHSSTSLTVRQLGNAAGGVSRTVGGIVGATGRGLGDTINSKLSFQQYDKDVIDRHSL